MKARPACPTTADELRAEAAALIAVPSGPMDLPPNRKSEVDRIPLMFQIAIPNSATR